MTKKLIILADRECFFLPHLIARLAKDELIESIIININKNSFNDLKKTALNMLATLGIWGLFELIFNIALAKIVDKLFKYKHYSLEKVAINFSLPLYYVNNLESKCLATIIGNSKTNLIFAQVGKKIKQELLGTGIFINKHCSLLPNYAGLMPVFWSMLNCERHIGVTLHLMNENFDSGIILMQQRVPACDHTFFSAYHELYNVCYYLIKKWCKKPFVFPIMDNSNPIFYSYPTYKDHKNFKKLGCRIGSAFYFHENINK